MSALTATQIARKAMRKAFKIFDTDRSGFIQLHELSLLLKKLADSFRVQHPSQTDILQVFQQIDINGDGKISRKQFESLIDEIVMIVEESGEIEGHEKQVI